jgi:hypothetical protein
MLMMNAAEVLAQQDACPRLIWPINLALPPQIGFPHRILCNLPEALRIGKRKTIVVVTHDITEATYPVDRVITISARPG